MAPLNVISDYLLKFYLFFQLRSPAYRWHETGLQPAPPLGPRPAAEEVAPAKRGLSTVSHMGAGMKALNDAKIGTKLAVSSIMTLLLVGGMALTIKFSMNEIADRTSAMRSASLAAEYSQRARYRFVSAAYSNLAIATAWRSDAIAKSAEAAKENIGVLRERIASAIDSADSDDTKAKLREAADLMERYNQSALEGTKTRTEVLTLFSSFVLPQADRIQRRLGTLSSKEAHIAATAMALHSNALFKYLMGIDAQMDSSLQDDLKKATQE